ncbi:MAG: DNA primase [bacterium]|nr:DNA primase [bacterium]
MDGNIEKIKDRVDIVELISSYLKVHKAGVNYKANCPFHNEKTPSFYISPSRQIWHCFGCSKGGDQFAFVQEVESVDFPEALRILAKRAGIELEKFDRTFQDSKTRLYEVCEWSAKFFQKQLESNTGKKVQSYLQGRGLQEETAKNFRLGYAPESWDSLISFLRDRGYTEQEIIDSGMAIKRDRGGIYDRFRSRVMFPIADVNGQIVGFTGRIFGKKAADELAKYVNTPQTILYDKSRILYGLEKAKLSIKQHNRCVVVEGNMDVIMSHQAGAANVVASSGTALTDQHLKIIKRYTQNLDLCFDADSAGRQAMERGIASALQQSFNLAVVSLDDPLCKDPADYVQKYGEKWQERLQAPQPIFGFYLQNALKTFDVATGTGKKMITEKVLPILKSIPNRVEQSHWIAELAMHLKVKDDLLWEQMDKMAIGPAMQAGKSLQDKQAFLATAKLSVLEDYLVSLLMIKPQLITMVSSVLSEKEIEILALHSFFNIFKNYINEQQQGPVMDYMVQKMPEGGEQSPMYLERLYLQAQELWQGFTDYDLELEFMSILNQLWRRTINAKLADLEFAIKQAEKNKNQEVVSGLVGQFQETASRLNQIKI